MCPWYGSVNNVESKGQRLRVECEGEKQTLVILYYYACHFIKSAVYVSYIVSSIEPRFSSGEGGGRLFKGGALIPNFKHEEGR